MRQFGRAGNFDAEDRAASARFTFQIGSLRIEIYTMPTAELLLRVERGHLGARCELLLRLW
jgi:hypothetical protein